MALLTERELKRIENRVRDDQVGDGAHDGPRDPDWERETLSLIETLRAAWATADGYALQRDEARALVRQLQSERIQLQDALREAGK